MALLYKPLTDNEALESIKTVGALNKEIASRFPDLSKIRLIAWASDLHLHPPAGYSFGFDGIYKHIDCTRQYSLCLHEINALEKTPDLIVLGGDITEMGMAEEWKEFGRIMKLGINRVPTLPVFGNHEHLKLPARDEMLKIWQEIRQTGWPDLDDPNEFYYSVVVNDIKHIVLDTVKLPGVVMSDRQKEFLAVELKDDSRMAVIYLHAHIMPAGNWTDGGLYLDRGMIDLINDSPHVLGVFSGHTHKSSLWKYLGKYYGTFPSVGYSIGDCTGWGGIIIDDQGIRGVFCKALHGESYDDCTGGRVQEGGFEFLAPRSFERDPRLNPFFWYRHPDPSKRG